MEENEQINTNLASEEQSKEFNQYQQLNSFKLKQIFQDQIKIENQKEIDMVQCLRNKQELYHNFNSNLLDNELFLLSKEFWTTERKTYQVSLDPIQIAHHIYKLQKIQQNLSNVEKGQLQLDFQDAINISPTILKDYDWIKNMLKIVNDLLFL